MCFASVICDIFIIRKLTDHDEQKKHKRRTWIRMGWLSCNGENTMAKTARQWLYLKMTDSSYVSPSIKKTIKDWLTEERLRELPKEIAEKRDNIQYYENKHEKMQLQCEALVRKQAEHLFRLSEEMEREYLLRGKAFEEFCARYDKSEDDIAALEAQMETMKIALEQLETDKLNLEQSLTKTVSMSSKRDNVIFSHLNEKITTVPVAEESNVAKQAFDQRMQDKRDQEKHEREHRKKSERATKAEDRKEQLATMLMGVKNKIRHGGGGGGASYSRRGAYDDEDDIIVSVPYQTRFSAGKSTPSSIICTDDTQELVI